MPAVQPSGRAQRVSAALQAGRDLTRVYGFPVDEAEFSLLLESFAEGISYTEGDCEWPRVAQALDGAGYQGWFTAEISGGDRERLAQLAARMARILAS